MGKQHQTDLSHCRLGLKPIVHPAVRPLLMFPVIPEMILIRTIFISGRTWKKTPRKRCGPQPGETGWQSAPLKSAATSPQSTAQIWPSASTCMSLAFDGTLTWAAALGCNYLGGFVFFNPLDGKLQGGRGPACSVCSRGWQSHSLEEQLPSTFSLQWADKQADSHDTVLYVLWVLQESLAEGVPWQSLG